MSLHRELRWLVAPALLALGSLAADAARAEPLSGVTSSPARVTAFVMPEVTAAAFGPGEHPKCAPGRLVLGSGGTVRSLDLAGGDEKKTSLKPLVGASVTSFIKDNHLVRMADDLVYSVEGYTHQALPCMAGARPCPKPSWWDFFATHPAKNHTEPGARSAIWFFRSQDCGVSWTLAGKIDAALLPVITHTNQTTKGLCGSPRPREQMVCDDADESEDLSKCPRRANQKFKKWAELGGFDGHYFAVHAESGRMVVSTMCVFGTQLTPGGDQRYHVLAVSDDGGAGWSARVVPRMGDPKKVPPVEPLRGIWRAPVMALDGDLWVSAYNDGTEVRVVADDPLTGTFSDDKSITVTQWTPVQTPDPVSLDTHLKSIGRGLALNPVPVGSTKPPGGPIFRPLVQLASHTWVDGKLPRFRVHNVDLSSEGVTTATSLIAPAAAGESVLQGAFIQGRRASLYYWLEERPGGQFRVRYQVYHRGKPMVAAGFFQSPGTIQGASGEHSFTGSTTTFQGDYVNGAHYSSETGTEHFIPVWNENGKVSFAEVRVLGLDDEP